MADLFRKSSLEKLSSPDQLDRAIVVTPLSLWLSLVGAGIIIVVALLWSIFGSLPVTVESSGVYVNADGNKTVYSEISGVVVEIKVAEGDTVKEGDVLASVGEKDVTSEIEKFDTRIAAVEKISFDSEDDVITSDNQAMVDIKNQIITLNNTLKQDEENLSLKQSQLTKQTASTNQSKSKLDAAEEEYYGSISTTNGSLLERNSTQAYSDYSSKLTAYESANTAYEQAKSSYETSKNTYDDGVIQYEAAKATLESLSSDPNADKTSAQATVTDLESKVAAGKIEVDNAKEVMDTAKDNRDNAKSSRDSAKSEYEDYSSQYEDYLADMGESQKNNTIMNNTYNIALSDYNTAASTLTSLQDTVKSLEVQVEVDKQNIESQTESIESQFNTSKASMLDQLNRERDKQVETLDKVDICATQSGTVYEIAVDKGSVITQGASIIKLKVGNIDEKAIVCYIPLNDGKKVKVGMDVMVYPTTVNKQEYGHMLAEVMEIDSYVSSSTQMMEQLGNDSLVSAFTQKGPVVAVTCKLITDESTASGYYWSSKKGKDILITEGTMVTATVVTNSKSPISMLIPYIKEKLTIKKESEG